MAIQGANEDELSEKISNFIKKCKAAVEDKSFYDEDFPGLDGTPGRMVRPGYGIKQDRDPSDAAYNALINNLNAEVKEVMTDLQGLKRKLDENNPRYQTCNEINDLMLEFKKIRDALVISLNDKDKEITAKIKVMLNSDKEEKKPIKKEPSYIVGRLIGYRPQQDLSAHRDEELKEIKPSKTSYQNYNVYSKEHEITLASIQYRDTLGKLEEKFVHLKNPPMKLGLG